MQMSDIKQAVILAGGRGARLKPLTDTMPKAMMPFYGKPFLEYVIENLKEQGIERILLLLGYLPEVIQDYFGDGEKLKVRIDYSVSEVENETGKRMKIAEAKLEPQFLFMYCDNYWPLQLEKMIKNRTSLGTKGQLTLYSNKDAYTKPNIRLDSNGIITQYDKSRTAPGLQMVDIGFGIFSKEVMEYLPGGNVSFENTVYPELVKRRQLAAYVSDHRYYSVSSFDRLHLTGSFLRREPAVILDRDGVLNVRPPKAEYVKNWNEFIWLPGAREAIAGIKKAGYRVIIVTNQAGIARRVMSVADLNDIHENMKREIEAVGGAVDAIYYCPHGWDSTCECRKPKPGMLFSAQRDFHLDLSRIFFIGDDIRDQQTAEAAGCKSQLVSEEYSLMQFIEEKMLTEA